jgi:23S rRNA (pseudouridine1915-N3)-methyltransferase
MSFYIQIICFAGSKYLFNKEVERFEKLIKPFASLSIISLKTTNAGNKRELMKIDEKKMKKKWAKNSYSVILSEEGKIYDCISFSHWISKRIDSGKPLTLNIGNAYGVSQFLKMQCNEIISLSPITIPNKICQLVLIEQLYRAFTILKGHPYHK